MLPACLVLLHPPSLVRTQILMLDAGRVLEAGHPHMLLNEGQGLASGGFASLVAETGPETEASLKQMAEEYWRKSTHGGQAPLSVSSP